jgi:SulP family sulfate permease
MASKSYRPHKASHLNPAIAEGISPDDSGDSTKAFSPPRDVVPGSMGNMGRSGLSVMMDREKAHRAAGPATSPSARDPDPEPPRVLENGATNDSKFDDDATPIARKATLAEEDSDSDDPTSGSALRRFLASEVAREDVERADESTPLLGEHSTFKSPSIKAVAGEWGRRAKKITARDMVRACVEDPVKAMPAVVLGLLLNVLDGVSYGMIL